jgi:hypothetical protein
MVTTNADPKNMFVIEDAITMSKFGGYGGAQKIDAVINEILEKHKITEDNFREWMLFTRTIETSLNLINEQIKQIRDKFPQKRRWDD